MSFIPRKPIRLPDAQYRGGDVFLVTICTHQKQPIFADEGRADLCFATIFKVARSTAAILFACCCMPDHVHIMLACQPGDSLNKFIGLYKSEAAKALRRNGWEGELWQRRYHDRGLTQQENLEQVAAYVLANPVRKGLATDWREWRWTWWCGEDMPL